MAAVKFSHTPSCMILTLVARKRPPGLAPATLDQVGDLGEAELAVPPERADHVGHQVAVRDRVDVRRAGVGHAGVRAHDRVLPGGHAEREEVALALDQPRGVVGRRERPGGAGDQRPSRPRAGCPRAAVREPLDPAVRRVRGLGGDAGQLERPRVDPGPVVVAVGQEHRTVRHDGVEVGRRRACRPGTPASPSHRRVIHGPSWAGGVRRGRREVVLAGASLGQVAAQRSEPALDRVAVGVGEAGRHQAAGQVDDLEVASIEACREHREPGPRRPSRPRRAVRGRDGDGARRRPSRR